MNSKKTEVEPHCSGHEHFEYDCIDCSDALERMRRGASPGDGTYTIPADVASLPEKWREENGDYPESKQDCADELKTALAKPASGDGLPDLPEAGYQRGLMADHPDLFTADQMLAIRDAGIAYGRRLATPASGWMPIKSAPKESRVILFCDARGNRWTQTADCRVPVCGLPPILWQELPPPPTPSSQEPTDE